MARLALASGKTRKHVPKTGYTTLSVPRAHRQPSQQTRDEEDQLHSNGHPPPVSAPDSVDEVRLAGVGRERCFIICVLCIQLPPYSIKTLLEDMEGLTKAAEEHMGNEMPDKFGLILDGWTHESEHYLAVFSRYEARAGPIYPLLSLALIVFDAAGRFDADAHLEAFVAFLPVLG
ncbi:hypothetical protein PPTG_05214 [Phytophthora nicotianae INRA-310]|uniref:Uncharacterized protein n=1 Tax=Phytophthora nicotianae (strain INRA-310) TaxID=761204 RepID=W2QW05_PHYN3|nr:hypothetical protein PPTG_05214 [Phytophthora nicotianae INRA-310]ETN17402.1 hypothetical protein PPTG_05214 [Phytophthora nicotianae INRA-310]